MSTLSRWLSRFCYKHPNFSIPGLMKYIAIGNVIVWMLDIASQGTFSPLISFIPGYIFQGQVWRLFTFIFVPISYQPIWFILSIMLYYFLGTHLEHAWGSTRFTVYYGLGVILTVIVGLLMGLTDLRWSGVVNMTYVNMSLFLAFATLYPDAEFRIYFFIPIRGKWLALVYGVFIVFDVLSWIGRGQYLLALVPVASLLNYLLFFWEDLTRFFNRGRSTVRHQTSRQTINFKSAQRQAQQQKGYLHKCAVCGITDADDRNMEFRYCSKCSGYHCYCANHINSHVHIQ